MTAFVTQKDDRAAESVVTTQRALARALDVSPMSITRWIREPGFPVEKSADGGTLFVVEEVREWLSNRRVRRRGPQPMQLAQTSDDKLVQSEALDLEARHYRAKVAKEEADAILKQRKAEVAEGRYVERSVYEQDLVSLAAVFRKVLHEQIEIERADTSEEAAAIVERVVSRVWDAIDEARAAALEAQGEGDE